MFNKLCYKSIINKIYSKSTFRLLVLLISISIGLGSHLPFETFSYKLLKNAENHDIPDLSIKSFNSEIIKELQTPKTQKLRIKAHKKAGKPFLKKI